MSRHRRAKRRIKSRAPIDFDALHRISASQMAVFDAFGPQVRSVLANAPEQLDAQALTHQLQMTPMQIRLADARVAGLLRELLINSYGDWIGRGH